MAKSFIDKFNEYTNGKFNYLKLSSVDVVVSRKTVTVNMIYPDGKQKEVSAETEAIKSAVERALNTAAEVSLKLTLSHFDKNFFMRGFREFLKSYPAVVSTVGEEYIDINDSSDAPSITLKLQKHVYDYCIEKKFVKDIETYLDLCYCEKIAVNLVVSDEAEDDDDFDDEELPVLELENGSERSIRPQNVDELIGAIIYDKAMYIEDAVTPKERAVICGKITRFDELSRRPKEGETVARKFYKMTLEDFTGSIDCLYFPNKYTQDKITLLQTGKEIVVRGSIQKDERAESGAVFFARDISYCTLPTEFTVNRIKRKVDEHYKTVFPKPCVITAQPTLFDFTDKKEITKSLLGRSYVVFDIETTGLNPRDDMIIEIGGVKIVDGVFTETFSTFIDPKIPIPERITELTGITDRDVVGAPLNDDVIIDFYKFTEGCILVGQNLQFDLSFVAIKGRHLNIYFDNDKMDTLYLARKIFPGLKKYKLGYLCSYLGVSLDHAHRALDDAMATAEVFVKILEKMDSNG